MNSLPKIPWDDQDGGVVQCHQYFSAVYSKQRSEAFVWWHWDAERGKYLMIVPAFYYASGGGLDYPPHANLFCRNCQVALFTGCEHCPHCGEDEDIQRMVVLGTSHSHGAGSAFHSSVDHANELDVTGFHITFGDIHRPPFIAPSFVVADGRTRFATQWTDHFQCQMNELAEARLTLWLSLVDSSTNMARNGGWVVVDAQERIIFAHHGRDQCEIWAKTVNHPDALRIIEKPAAAQKVEMPRTRVLSEMTDSDFELAEFRPRRTELFREKSKSTPKRVPKKKEGQEYDWTRISLTMNGKPVTVPDTYRFLVTCLQPQHQFLGLYHVLNAICLEFGLDDTLTKLEVNWVSLDPDFWDQLLDTITYRTGSKGQSQWHQWREKIEETIAALKAIAEAHDKQPQMVSWMISGVFCELERNELTPVDALVEIEKIFDEEIRASEIEAEIESLYGRD